MNGLNPTPFKSEYRGLGPPVGPEANGRRLDHFLASTFPFRSRREWKETCVRGHLLVNNRPARPTLRLKNGDRLESFHPLSAEPEVDTRIELIAESGGILALYKPGNLPMHESGFYRRNTLAALLAERLGDEWAPVHRLDRETSGIVICAGTPDLRRRLSQDFESRVVSKEYLAIAKGSISWDKLSVDQPLSCKLNDRIPRALVTPDGAPCLTHFQVLERRTQASLLSVHPQTGRPNQIRAHIAWAGYPLIGDKLYQEDQRIYDAYYEHGDTPLVRELAGFERHALHAAAICIKHPSTGKDFVAHSPLPPDLSDLWSKL